MRPRKTHLKPTHGAFAGAKHSTALKKAMMHFAQTVVSIAVGVNQPSSWESNYNAVQSNVGGVAPHACPRV